MDSDQAKAAGTAAGLERRQYGRIELDDPLPATLDGAAVSVVEVSVTGFRVAHDFRLPPLPLRNIVVNAPQGTLAFSCSIIRSVLFRLARRPGEATIYHSGVKIVGAVDDSEQRLRELIAQRVVRALEQQKANAHGIPPIDSQLVQPVKVDRYRRCELVDGVWRRMETTNTQQPDNGFTISAAVDPRHVDMLCRTFEETTAEGRRLTQILAQLSISKREGGPIRRYDP